MNAPVAFELIRRKPSKRIAHLVSEMNGYRELALGRFYQREAAPLAIPLIISFGSPFSIALGREPAVADKPQGFAGGLYAGPVHIRSDGEAECVEVDFTPLGAYRFFGGGVVDLAGRTVELGDVFGDDGGKLRERLGATSCWESRFELVENWMALGAKYEPSPEVIFCYRRLALNGGNVRVTTLAEEIGWSRKHLVQRFRSEIGLGPKSLARIMRFHWACRLAQTGTSESWAMIAAQSGYSDQAHLTRDFGTLAGESPTAWARRLTIVDVRLTRPSDAFAGG